MKSQKLISVIEKFWTPIILTVIVLIYFYPVFLGYIPFPGEVLKAYYPWKNLTWEDPPFVTHSSDYYDTVRAIYPWQTLAIEKVKSGQSPNWNEYAFSGTPLLANNQSAPLYPLNYLMLFAGDKIGWGILTILQPLLASLFMWLLLKEYQLKNPYALWGSLSFGWSELMAYFMNQHVIGHTLLWLPLIIFCLHKIKINFLYKWYILFVTSLTFSLLAGHLQTSIYYLVFIILYLIFILKFTKRQLIQVFSGILISLIFASPQIIPTLNYLKESSRSANFYTDFLLDPLQLGRILLPHFLGHPAQNNWFNPHQMKESAYIGSLGLLFAFNAIFIIRQSPLVRFCFSMICLIIILLTNNPLSNLLYSQFYFLKLVSPVRLMGIVVFLLAILSSTGLQYLFEDKTKIIKKSLLIIGLLILLLGLIYFRIEILKITTFNKRLFLSPILFLLGSVLILFTLFKIKWKKIVLGLILTLSITEILIEHALIARTFTPYDQIFPETKLTNFLQDNIGQQRFLSIDPWILPPNTFIPYKLKTVSIYDPLQMKSKALYFQNWQWRFEPNKPPFVRAFEITGYSVQFLKENDIKYVLSTTKLDDQNLKFIKNIDGVLIYQFEPDITSVFLLNANANNKKNDPTK